MATKPETVTSANVSKLENPLVKIEVKSEIKAESKPEVKTESKPVREPVARMSTATLKAEMEKIDNKINELAAGKQFNSATMRLMAQCETEKHRLLMNRLAALLKKGHVEVQPIVEKLLSIEI
jgi:hypothetical protein